MFPPICKTVILSSLKYDGVTLITNIMKISLFHKYFFGKLYKKLLFIISRQNNTIRSFGHR